MLRDILEVDFTFYSSSEETQNHSELLQYCIRQSTNVDDAQFHTLRCIVCWGVAVPLLQGNVESPTHEVVA